MSGPQHRASRCVFVGNIPYDATEEQLVQICEEVGPVVSFRLVVDRDTGKPKGYGFCEFRDEETALSARRNLQGYDINGRQLRVDFAENEKGGGGVDRNRDQQGRGGPGFQQSGSHLDAQKQGVGSVGPPPGLGAAGPAPLEQPFGRAAASAAALVMQGAIGGMQQVPNTMVQGQGPIQVLSAAQAPISGNGGTAAGADALTNLLAGTSKHQLYEIMTQMKIMLQQNQQQARQILVANPQLTKALFQAQIMLGMVHPQQVVAGQPTQGQQQSTQQPVMQQQQPAPPRPLQSHVPQPAQMQPQPNKANFQPPLPQQPQQQQQQQVQPPPQPQLQQQPQLPPPPQGSFQLQGGLAQTSLGMSFQQGPPPPPPNQPPPQQLYQMGSNMMGANLPRMSTNVTGGLVGQGNTGMLSSGGSMLPGGSGQMPRGPLSGGLGSMDNRGVQMNLGLPSTGGMGSMSGVHVQAPMAVPGPMSSGHSLVSGNAGGVGGMGQPALPTMLGDPSGRGYSGMNAGMNAPMNQGVNTGMNATMNTGLMNTGMPQGLNQGFSSNVNGGMNPSMSMNPGLTMGLNVPQGGAFAGTTDGTSVTSATLQPQNYSQTQLQPPPGPQQMQGQVPLELEQQKALLQQVMNLTTEQIMSLPPDQRQQVLQLQQVLR